MVGIFSVLFGVLGVLAYFVWLAGLKKYASAGIVSIEYMSYGNQHKYFWPKLLFGLMILVALWCDAALG